MKMSNSEVLQTEFSLQSFGSSRVVTKIAVFAVCLVSDVKNDLIMCGTKTVRLKDGRIYVLLGRGSMAGISH
jgi:hypothetical protein